MVKILNKSFTIYFVRHGETEYNVTHQMQGWCDSPLTKRGIASLKEVREKLAHIKFDKIYSSSLPRAIASCEILTDKGYEINDLFKEMHFGKLEATYEGEVINIEEKQQELLQGYKQFGGESMDEFKKRIIKSFEFINENAENGQAILVITHGVYIMMVRLLLTSKMFDKKIDNGSITSVLYDGSYQMIGD